MTARSWTWLVLSAAAVAVIAVAAGGAVVSGAVAFGAPAQEDPPSPPQGPPQVPGGRGGPGGPGGFGGPGGIEPMLSELNLTAEQKQEIKKLQETERAAAQPYQESLREIEAKIRAACQSESFSVDSVRELAAEQAKATVELTVLRSQTTAGIYQLLTAEQRETLKQRQAAGPRRRR